jgi:hypothetical protein
MTKGNICLIATEKITLNSKMPLRFSQLSTCICLMPRGVKWSAAKDAQPVLAVLECGLDWVKVSQRVPLTTARMCRERWDIVGIPPRPWTADDDRRLQEMVAESGPRWVWISKGLIRLPSACLARWRKLREREREALRPPPLELASECVPNWPDIFE